MIFKVALVSAALILLALLGFAVYDSFYAAPGVEATANAVNVSGMGHPYLLFHDIAETQGYQGRSSSPWSEWEASVIKSANEALSRDYSKRWSDDYVSVRAGEARDLALAYQITKDTAYAVKAREALLSMDVGEAPDAQKNMSQLLGYCLAYDWVQPCLIDGDDGIIRDKLAKLADTAYRGLNKDNARRDYIATVDFHLPWYPIMGIAGATLSDYTNPGGLSLSSTPADWQKVGTDYLFVSDALHDYKKPLASFQWDDEGKDLLGAYKLYYTDEFMWWSQVYTHYYGKDFFEEYPLARGAFTSEAWESLPNHYSNDFVTNGNVIYAYHGAFMNLLNDTERAEALFHERSIDAGLLPYSRTLLPLDMAGPSFLYLTYHDYSGVQATAPSWTSHLGEDSVYQVFRESWNNDSEWLGLITYDINTLSNRNNAHHDQLSLEYYGSGDLLLSDAGENRFVLDQSYGAYETDHNGVALEDPRSPFSVSSWSNSRARGIFKGNSERLATPSHIRSIVQAPWMELVDADVSVTSVVKDNARVSMPLSSSIGYERCVLFPEKDYFIVVDRLEGSEPWTYRNVFRPTSLSIVPTADKNRDGSYAEDEVGQVKGSLTIGGTPYDWASKQYKSEASTGVNTSHIEWATTNPYGRDVEMQLYSVPSSEVLVEKLVSRVGGYNAQNEVFSPAVVFKAEAGKSLYRATVILSGYAGDAQRSVETIPVGGEGNAMKVGSTDYVYTGNGIASFDQYSTDADILFMRNGGSAIEYTLIGGTFIHDQGTPLLTSSDNLDYVTLKQEGSRITLKVKASKSVSLKLYPKGAASAPIVVNAEEGEHEFELTF
jgi:hypothetical protein